MRIKHRTAEVFVPNFITLKNMTITERRFNQLFAAGVQFNLQLRPFIFFTAFAFLNMVIGVVVNVLNEESDKINRKEQQDLQQISMEDLDKKIEELKVLISQRSPSSTKKVSR